jgi:hypothetical protein
MYRRGEPVVEESIYALLPEPAAVEPKGPMYRSLHPKKAEARALPGSTFVGPKKAMGTMGPVKVPPPAEQPMLRKHAKEHVLPARTFDPESFCIFFVLIVFLVFFVIASKFEYAEPVEKRPPVVKRDEKPTMGLKSSKNFITSNAVEAILAGLFLVRFVVCVADRMSAAVPKKTATRDVNFLEKPDFGRVPAYLEKVKETVAREYEYVRALHATDSEPSEADRLRLLDEDERLMILEGLKTRWAALNKQYQTLSFTIDTINKRVRKEQYEKELAEIEKDIERMSKKSVYVAV